MTKILMLTALLSCILFLKTHSQKRYGYTVLSFRCGDNDPGKDRVYYSPIIELNTLNFPQYTDGVDPEFSQFSVRYYNYAISKWFESFLRDKHKIMINSLDKYARKSSTVIYNETGKNGCNGDKTSTGCFFLNKEELFRKRQEAINESRSAKNSSTLCEVIDL